MAIVKKKTFQPSDALETITSSAPTQKKETVKSQDNSDVTDFMNDLFKGVTKEMGDNSLIDLTKDDSYITVKHFLSTGSRQLDYAIANARDGGLPEGRIIEICGPTTSGKTTLAILAAAILQKKGGLVIYIDSEQALNKKRVAKLGLDLNNLGYSPATVTERIFDLIEKTVIRLKAREKKIPILIVWDSVAAALPKAEAEATHEQQTIGLQARALRKGLRKINELLAGEKATFVILNHITQKIGVMYGSPDTTTGGTAIPFWSSVRIKINSPSPIKEKDDIIGVSVTAKIIKNKIERPFREVSFDIMFDKGINEADHIFDVLRAYSDKNKVTHNGKKITLSGASQWRCFTVTDETTGEIITEIKFYKSEFENKVMNNPGCKEYFEALMDAAYIIKDGVTEHDTLGTPEINEEGREEDT